MVECHEGAFHLQIAMLSRVGLGVRGDLRHSSWRRMSQIYCSPSSAKK